MRRVFPIVSALLAVIGASLALPAQAQVETQVIVLGLRSTDGDDDFARSLSGVLRHAAEQVRGWSVSPRDVSLAQMLVANGCDDANIECLGQIARGLHMQRVVFGSVHRSAPTGEYTFDVTLGVYNAQTNTIEHSVVDSLPRTRIDIDDLRSPARRYVLMLSGQAPEGSLVVRASEPLAHVLVDGREIAPFNGSWVVNNLALGTHTVDVTAPGRVPFHQDVSITLGEQTTVNAPLPLSPPQTVEPVATDNPRTSRRGSDLPDIPRIVHTVPPERSHGGQFWTGAVLTGAGAVALGMTVFSWSRLHSLNGDAEFSTYRDTPRDPANAGDVCDAAEAGDTVGAPPSGLSHIQSVCSQASTFTALQYVFLVAGLAGVGIGTYLMITDEGEEDPNAGLSLAITPSFSAHGGNVNATLRF
ncbi:MAG: hypothetical protein IPK60_15235 [Sandaracinaceae bacterium]|jgi:hypothetical protein|nr:hypothetical protein [Sandaracinaceae bacterium]